jgi:periplasmic protein TonB
MATNMNMTPATSAASANAIGNARATGNGGGNYGGSGKKGLFSKGPIGLVVLAAHLALIYGIAVSLGIMELPSASKPMEAVVIDAPPVEQSEPVPVVKPDLDAPPIETPPLENTIPEPEIVTDTPAPAAIQMETAPAQPVAETANMKVNRRVDPVYPATSRRNGEEGTGMFRVLVDERGRPIDVQVLKTSGFPKLDQAALEAIRKWSFSPAMQGGAAVKSWTRVQVAFQLEGK